MVYRNNEKKNFNKWQERERLNEVESAFFSSSNFVLKDPG